MIIIKVRKDNKMPKQPFTPPTLPPDLDLAVFIKLIADAREALARYDEAVKHLPNPTIVRRAFETKEAVLSSKIEGTQATLEEVLELDAKEIQEENNEKQRDYREIFNYRNAIAHGKKLLENKPLSENVIKELHKMLLNSVRGKNKTPGEFRKHQVHIGPAGATIDEANYIPPEHTKIPNLFSDLVKYMQDDNQPDRLVQAAIAHYQFEAFHPFADGNGRVGRIIIPIYLFEKGVTSYPNLYVSEFLETYRRDYYDSLNCVSNNGDWNTWISFFLRAVREQAKITKARVDAIDKLYKEIHITLPEFNSIYAPNFLDAIFSTPVFTATSIGKRAEIPYNQTVYTLVNKFAEKGLIQSMTPNKSRNKLYMFGKLLDIIDATNE
jgi:Fic family protein